MAVNAEKNREEYRDSDTVIGRGAVLNGSLAIEHNLRVDGTLRGERLSTKETLIVGREGQIESATIEVGEAIIDGRVIGVLEAKQQVHMEAGAKFRGILKTPRLVIEDGATLEEDRSVGPGEKNEED